MKDNLPDGHYRVVEILAGGSFGQSYVPEDTHQPGNPKYIVQHLKPASIDSNFLQNALALFQSEAETLKKLGNHDQIPRLLAYFEENQEFYLVQDFIQGHPLSAELQPGQRWTETKVCQFLQEVLGILVFVHSHEVIHQDIKPDNLIRRQHDSRLVLVDFGAVKQIWTQLLTAQGQVDPTIVVGTPGYMPTEQAQGKPRPNSDIYALGIIGIQALTGLNPMQFEDDPDTGEILWQHQAHVSDALASILTKMVCYHFKDRYQTAAEVLQALQLLVNRELDSNEAGEAEGTPSPPSSAPPAAPNPKGDPWPPALLAQVDLKEKYPSIPATHKQFHLRIGAGITAVLISMVAGYAIYWQPGASIQKTLEQIETLKAEGRYSECVNQATTVPKDSRFLTDAQALLHECQLAQATRFAADGNFKAAITKASKIPKDAASHQDAQQLIGQLSHTILEIATNKYHSGNLNDAIAIAKTIPEISPVYPQAQGAIKQWNREWEKNNSYLKAANRALDEGRWQNAISSANKVIDTPYWKQKIGPITQKAESKIAESKTAVTSQPTRVTRPPTRTPRRRLTRTTPKLLTRTTPKQPTRTTPKQPTRTTPKQPTRTTPKLLTRTPRRRLTRSAPPKRSYRWTTKTVP